MHSSGFRPAAEPKGEKTQLFGQNFPKSASKRLSDFFQNVPAAQKFWSKWCLYSDLGEKLMKHKNPTTK